MLKRLSRISDYDAILKTIDIYLSAAVSGDGDKMQFAFTDDAIMHGYIDGVFVGGPIQTLFDWVGDNAGGTNVRFPVASVDIIGTIATVRVEIENWVGFNFTDVFSLLKTDTSWLIVSKVYHTHS